MPLFTAAQVRRLGPYRDDDDRVHLDREMFAIDTDRVSYDCVVIVGRDHAIERDVDVWIAARLNDLAVTLSENVVLGRLASPMTID